MGASIAFLHPADLGGVLTELVQSPAQRELHASAACRTVRHAQQGIYGDLTGRIG